MGIGIWGCQVLVPADLSCPSLQPNSHPDHPPWMPMEFNCVPVTSGSSEGHKRLLGHQRFQARSHLGTSTGPECLHIGRSWPSTSSWWKSMEDYALSPASLDLIHLSWPTAGKARDQINFVWACILYGQLILKFHP